MNIFLTHKKNGVHLFNLFLIEVFADFAVVVLLQNQKSAVDIAYTTAVYLPIWVFLWVLIRYVYVSVFFVCFHHLLPISRAMYFIHALCGLCGLLHAVILHYWYISQMETFLVIAGIVCN